MCNKMEQLTKLGEVYCAREQETSTKKCYINLSRRLPLLSRNTNSFEDCIEEWTVITGKPSSDEKKMCLCGHFIEDIYYYKNEKTNKVCQIGSKCCERINIKAIKDYKKSLIKSGSCHVCDTVNKNIETHCNSEGHKKKYKVFIMKFKIKLASLLYEKIFDLKYENEVLSLKFINKKLVNFTEKHIIKQKINEKNFNRYKDYRKCIEPYCIEYISKKEPSWKIRCKRCYISKMNDFKF